MTFARTPVLWQSRRKWAFLDLEPLLPVTDRRDFAEGEPMKSVRIAVVLAVATTLTGGNLLACGDKFLVGSRGTRYSRPRNARAASVVIYADPSSDAVAATTRLESMLKRQGHHAIVVTTIDQLSAFVTSNRVDVVLAATGMAARLEQLIGTAALITLDAQPKPARLLGAIDKAVEQQTTRVPTTRSR
jgi:hypothetical protein